MTKICAFAICALMLAFAPAAFAEEAKELSPQTARHSSDSGLHSEGRHAEAQDRA